MTRREAMEVLRIYGHWDLNDRATSGPADDVVDDVFADRRALIHSATRRLQDEDGDSGDGCARVGGLLEAIVIVEARAVKWKNDPGRRHSHVDRDDVVAELLKIAGQLRRAMHRAEGRGRDEEPVDG